MARKGGSPIKVVTPLIRTVKPPYQDWPVDSVVPGWDDIPGMSQHARRISMSEQPTKPYGGTDSNHPPRKSNHPRP